MAIIPSSRYPAQIDTSDAGYPHGKPRNSGSYQDGTGTPLEKDWLADLFGLEQALLVAAAITPSGTPDKVGASQYLAAIVKIASRILADATLTVDSGGKIDLSPGADLNVAAGADLNVASGGDINVASGGRVDVVGGGHIDLSGGAINVQTGGSMNLLVGSHLNVGGGAFANVSGTLSLDPGSALNVQNTAALNVLDGAALDIETGGILNVNTGGRIDLNGTSELNVEGAAHIDVEGRIDVISGVVNVYSATGVTLQSGGRLNVNTGSQVIAQSGAIWRIEDADDLTINNSNEGYRLTLTPAWNDGWIPSINPDVTLCWMQSLIDYDHSIWFALPVNPGDTVVDVYARVNGISHPPPLPPQRPILELVSTNADGAVTVHATSVDPSPSVAEYNLPHNIVLKAGFITTGIMPRLATYDPFYVRLRGVTTNVGLSLLSISGNITARSYRAANMVR